MLAVCNGTVAECNAYKHNEHALSEKLAHSSIGHGAVCTSYHPITGNEL